MGGREPGERRERKQTTAAVASKRKKKTQRGRPTAGSSSLLGSHKPSGATTLALPATLARKSEVAERRRRAGSGLPVLQRKQSFDPFAASKNFAKPFHSSPFFAPRLFPLRSLSSLSLAPKRQHRRHTTPLEQQGQRWRGEWCVFPGADAAIILCRAPRSGRPEQKLNCSLPSKDVICLSFSVARAPTASAFFPCKTAPDD